MIVHLLRNDDFVKVIIEVTRRTGRPRMPYGEQLLKRFVVSSIKRSRTTP